MEQFSLVTDHPKRRRRRRRIRSPISGWLKLGQDLKGEVGRLSDDLYADLFRDQPIPAESTFGASEIRYIAITPWSSRFEDPVADETWCIVPVVSQEITEPKATRLPPSTVIFSATSLNLRGLVDTLPGRVIAENSKGGSGVAILVLDVEPLSLHTVVVEINGNALERHYEVQRKFGGGFSFARTNGIPSKGKEKAHSRERIGDASKNLPLETQEKTLIIAIRQALGLRLVIRQDDLLSLPLPAHPITHESFPLARIALTEPVGQGRLVPSTQILVKRVFGKVNMGQRLLPSGESHLSITRPVKKQDHTPNSNQFVPAVEYEDVIDDHSSLSGDEGAKSSSSELDAGDLSDDSSDNVISMSIPRILTDSYSAESSLTSITPRDVHSKLSGFNSPGSMYSSHTSTTVRQDLAIGKGLFQAKALLCKISEPLLHPRPHGDEDEEARVFVGVKMLLRLGCFSGEWVKIDACTPSIAQHSPRDDGFNKCNEIARNFRAAKIYGIPDLSFDYKYRRSRASEVGRLPGSNNFASKDRPMHSAWFSPVLLANLGSPSLVRISPLENTSIETGFGPKTSKTKLSSFSSPPIAKEITLVKISTPLSTEMALQTSLFTALKHHFQGKRRILQYGDLVPLTIDTTLGRILAHSGSASTVGKEGEDNLSMDLIKQNKKAKMLEVCWFRVQQVVGSALHEDQGPLNAAIWGCWACIEPMTTFVLQGGTETARVISTMDSSWEYYLGIKPSPNYGASSSAPEISSRPPPRIHVTSLRQRLRDLIFAGISLEAAQRNIGSMFVLLYSTQRHVGKATLVMRACTDLGAHVFSINAHNLLAESGAGGADIKTELIIRAQAERALSCNPETTIVLIRHIEALSGDRMTIALKDIVTKFRVVVATTTAVETVSEDMRSLFTHELEVPAPDETEREGILRTIVNERSIRLSYDVDLAAIAIKTAALVAGDLADVLERALIAREHRLEDLTQQGLGFNQSSAPILIRDILVSGGESVRCVNKADFDIAVDAARKNFADSIGAPKIPNVSWEDIGGLEHVKSAVMETIQLPLERPELFAKGIKKRSGILFYGPPGTGKTLLAKAIATEFSLNFFSVKGPELLNMYIGESEANVRRVFQRARDARPCVVFFDELDSVAPKRGNQGDSGGVMDRIVSQLLAELDGMSSGEAGGGGVFVIGATNRPDLLDQALLRPGRFDKMLYLGVSDTHEKQLRILEALTRNFKLGPEVSLRRVAESLPFTYTGADLYAICSDAMLKAITRQCTAVDSRIKVLDGGAVTPAYFFDHLATQDDIDVTVREQDFIDAQREFVGSVR